jgi:hypothetical protein
MFTPLDFARLAAGLLLAYLAAGLLFALWFTGRAIVRFDLQARGARWAFRVLVVPGLALLWPVVWAKWRQARA